MMLPVCNRNGSLWYTKAQTPLPDYSGPCKKNCRCETGCDCGGVACGEYLYDHRNASVREWLAGYHTLVNGVGEPSIDGYYIDDGWSSKANPSTSYYAPCPGGGCGPSEIPKEWQVRLASVWDPAAVGAHSCKVCALTTSRVAWCRWRPG